MATPLRLLRESGLMRHNLVVFALLTACLNGIVTASVGAWLARSYSDFQSRRGSVQSLADLVYERRARAGLVVSTLRRGADIDELRYRKRAYDDVYVEWNKRIQNNLLQIRDVIGTRDANSFESLLQDGLVPALSEMDGCLTRGYDARMNGQDPMVIVDACRYPVLHQFALDCAKGITDELYRLTRLTFIPRIVNARREVDAGSARAAAACTREPTPPSAVLPADVPSGAEITSSTSPMPSLAVGAPTTPPAVPAPLPAGRD